MATGNKHGFHRKDTTEKRRKIIADLMFKEGIDSQAELMRILDSQYGIKASRETISRDKKSLSGLRFDDEMRDFDNFVLAKMKRNYIAEEALAEAAHKQGDIRLESDIRKKLSSMSKEFHEVNHRIFEADKRSSRRVKEGVDATSFSFGEVKVTENPLKKDSAKEEVVE